MKNKDIEIKRLIQESSDFSLGEDFTRSLMERLERETITEPRRIYEYNWNVVAILLSFLMLLVYLFLNPSLLVHIIQPVEVILSYISINTGVMSISLAMLFLYIMDTIARKRFTFVFF
jgi:polyferredoxin